MKQNSVKVVECKISITFCSFTGLAENQKVLVFAEKIKFCKTCESTESYSNLTFHNFCRIHLVAGIISSADILPILWNVNLVN